MPTSSQAMILRESHSTHFRAPIADYKTFCHVPSIENSDNASPTGVGNCEIVKFDFSVTTSPEKSINGFQGVFAFDQKTKSYRWQICSVQPKSRNELGNVLDYSSGDIINPNDHLLPLQDDELVESDSFVKSQPSDHTQHFTTPTASLLDNSRYRQATELHGKTHLLNSLKIPPDDEFLDENAYRRLEQLGFRRRTTYSPGGTLIRSARTQGTPQKCLSDPLAASKLSIKTMDVTKVPVPTPEPVKNQGFHPKPILSGGSIRKRVRPRKPKTLLEEVKECVDWDHRVSPGIHRRRGKPSFIPTAVCFSVKNGWKYSHADIKKLFETQTGCKVKALLFDPVTVREGDASSLDRWVVTLGSWEDSQKVIPIGIAVDGDHVTVRAWDAILKEEHIPDDEGWEYPCNYRLKSTDKQKLILRNFLSTQS